MALLKPERIFDRDQEWQDLTRFVAHRSTDVRLGVVSGRRRQGKTYLLDALAEITGGFYFAATESTDAAARRSFGAALASYTGAPAPFQFDDWDDAVNGMYRAVPAGLIVLDEFPFLMKSAPQLPSILQRELGPRGAARGGSLAKLLLCGSAMAVMGRLLAANAPLRGRASLDLVIQPLDYRQARRFWGIDDLRLAVCVHAIVGGTPAYRREFIGDDVPQSMDDFDDWVLRTILNPAVPLYREARYLLGMESEIRDPQLYYTVLEAIARGNATNGSIANYMERKTAEIAHPLRVLEDSQLIAREQDAFRKGRSYYRIAEPLVTFYEAIMRPAWTQLQRRQSAAAWSYAQARFQSQVLGPHFEALCREFTASRSAELFGEPAHDVLPGVVADPSRKAQIEVDVVSFGIDTPGAPRRIISLGEAKWGDVMGVRHLSRLRRARDLLAAKGYSTADATLVCYSGAGFDSELRVAARNERVLLIDLDLLYQEPSLQS